MVERRRHARHSATTLGNWRYAQIVSPEDQAIDCTIENLSWGGACLLVSNPAEIPEAFNLVVKELAVREHCRKIWQSGKRIGVMFQERGQSSGRDFSRNRTILGSDHVRRLLTQKLASGLKRLPRLFSSLRG